MNFDEAKKEIDEALDLIDYEDMPNIIDGIIDSLKEEYAPTVEMTKEHRVELLMMRDNQEPLVEILADLDGGVLLKDFDNYWEPLTEKQLIQAWLNPETIVVTDSE